MGKKDLQIKLATTQYELDKQKKAIHSLCNLMQVDYPKIQKLIGNDLLEIKNKLVSSTDLSEYKFLTKEYARIQGIKQAVDAFENCLYTALMREKE